MSTSQAIGDTQIINQDQQVKTTINSNNQAVPQQVLLPSFEYQRQDSLSQQERTLWIGDLPNFWEESHVLNLFYKNSINVQSVKIIRNKQTKASEGYGFVQFDTQQAAYEVLSQLNQTAMPGTQTPFKLNWAAYGVGKNNENDFSIFVGDLTSEVNDSQLEEHFKKQYASVKSAKVIVDSLTGRSKGFGFVKFGSSQDRNAALSEVGGQYLGARPIRVSLAVSRKLQNEGQFELQQQTNPLYPSTFNQQEQSYFNKGFDNNNTTIFVGGLNSSINQDNLKQYFNRFGNIVNIKIPPGKGCGFVQYTDRQMAEAALHQMNGQVIGSSKVRTSWGRSSKQLKLYQQQQMLALQQQQQQQMQQQQQQQQQQQLTYPYGYNKFNSQQNYPQLQYSPYDQNNSTGTYPNIQGLDLYGNFQSQGAQQSEYGLNQQQGGNSNNPFYSNAYNSVNKHLAAQQRVGSQNLIEQQPQSYGVHGQERQILKNSVFNNISKGNNYNDRDTENDISQGKLGVAQNYGTQGLSLHNRNYAKYPGV